MRAEGGVIRKAHGIGLLSGGLDSALAALVVRDAGAQVTCLHFFTGFCVTGHNSRVGRKNRPIANHALQVAADIGIAVELIDISEEYLSVVMRPKHGYGANMNPCVDCRIFIARNRLETLAHRQKRNRGTEAFDPFIEDVLGTEHKIIAGHRALADVILSRDFDVAWAS
jgi:NH3-dependent NAD+ synthetase